MELSLRFLANKLAFSYDIEVLNELPAKKYGTVRLFDSALSTSTKYNPVVIIPAQYQAENVSPEFEGIIWLGQRKPAFEQPAIWVKDEVSELLILDRIQNIFDMHNQWCDTVRNALLTQTTFADVVPLLSHVTINPFYYADASFRTLAIKDDDTLYASSSSWRMQSEVGRHPVEILSKFVTSGELGVVNERHEAWLFNSKTFHVPFVSKTIFCQGDVFGHLFIVQTYPNQETFDVALLEEFGNMLEAHLNLSTMTYSSSGRPFEPMLINQLSGVPENAVETDYLLKLLSWRYEDRYHVVVFSTGRENKLDDSEGLASIAIQAIEDNLSSSKALLFDGNLVCIVNDCRPESVSTENLAIHLCERFGWKAAISDLGASFSTIRALYKRALATMEAGLKNDPASMLYSFEDYRLGIVFSTLIRHTDEDFLMHDDLRTLIAYDEKTGSEFVDTLKTYLDNERNSKRTADIMYLHRNSIAYRLEKMRSLMTSDLDDPENRLFLMLSIYLWLSREKNGR